MIPRVMLIVLNWNGLADTLECLDSLMHLDYPAYEVVVVDNGSTDGSVEVISDRFPGVTLIENNENLGYAEGNNRGISYALKAGADYVLVLNNDTVLCQDLLTHLVRVAEADSRVGAVGPKIYYHMQPHRIWFAGGMIDWQRGFTVNLGADEDDAGQFEEVKSVDFLAGCALLIRRETWEDVGPFDSRYFMYWEETDWCTRVRRAGYDLLFVPQAKMWHKVSTIAQSQSSRVLYYMTRNRFFFFYKHVISPCKRVAILARHCWGVFRAITRFLRRGEYEQSQALIRGTWDFFGGRFGRILQSRDKGAL